jgi:hypothetical protein
MSNSLYDSLANGMPLRLSVRCFLRFCPIPLQMVCHEDFVFDCLSDLLANGMPLRLSVSFCVQHEPCIVLFSIRKIRKIVRWTSDLQANRTPIRFYVPEVNIN